MWTPLTKIPGSAPEGNSNLLSFTSIFLHASSKMYANAGVYAYVTVRYYLKKENTVSFRIELNCMYYSSQLTVIKTRTVYIVKSHQFFWNFIHVHANLKIYTCTYILYWYYAIVWNITCLYFRSTVRSRRKKMPMWRYDYYISFILQCLSVIK